MMRTTLKILSWAGIAVWFAVVMGFVSGESREVLCNRLEVIITDTIQNRFVTSSMVREMLGSSEFQLQGYPLSGINTRKLEQTLEMNPHIMNAEVSKDISGKLEVVVEQRVPLVRILPDGQRGFYLDTGGGTFPLSDRFTPLILLASGHIPSPGTGPELSGKLEEIFVFCSYLEGHPFWKNQIVQIYVNSRGEYELIPRVGAHQILLGSMEHWQEKLKNLELLYNQGLSRYGWNTYRTINLKYANQVICTKR
jgi:cell division protein FtsQ